MSRGRVQRQPSTSARPAAPAGLIGAMIGGVLASVLALALSACSTTGEPRAAATSAPASPGSATAPATPTAPASTGSSGTTRPVAYVALGDSYAAAPGVPETSLAGGCARSDHNYPHLLAAARPELALTDD